MLEICKSKNHYFLEKNDFNDYYRTKIRPDKLS